MVVLVTAITNTASLPYGISILASSGGEKDGWGGGIVTPVSRLRRVTPQILRIPDWKLIDLLNDSMVPDAVVISL